MATGVYPIDIAVDYPQTSSRAWAILTMLGIKNLALIPHFIVLYALHIIAGILFFLSQIIVLFTGTYPEGMASFVANTLAWQARVNAFTYGLTDQYPPFTFEGETAYALSFTYDYPATSSRTWAILTMLFIRFLALIPQAIVLAFVGIAAALLFFVSQIVVLITGSYPEGMFAFMVGTIRWSTRVSGFMYALTDSYPPFSLS
jgi:hypothetical protein